VALSLGLVIPSLTAQTASAPHLGVTTKEDWPQVYLNVLVRDRNNFPDTQLTLSDFQLLEDSAPQRIHTMAGVPAPVSVCILVDSSASSKAVKPAVKDAVRSIVQALPSRSEVTISEFGDQAFLDLPFTPASQVPGKIYERLDSRGGTALFDALMATEDYFQAHARWQRRAMVLITDGGENASRESQDAVIRTLLSPSSPILYVLAYPGPTARDTSPRQIKRDEDRLDLLSRMGGGLVFSARNNDDILTRAANIGEAIRSQYALAYTTEEPMADPRLHKLEVRIPQDKAKLKIYGQPGFYTPDR
jgi:VWFA-related protein